MRANLDTLSISSTHESYSGVAERQIRTMMLTGTLSPGERVNELELSETFEISRGPIREAIQRLATEGLLEVRPHRGAVVRTFDRQEVADMTGVQIALETYAIRMAAENASDTQLKVFASLVDKDGDADRPQGDTSPERNESAMSFHRSIVLLASNTALLKAHSSVMQKIVIAWPKDSEHQLCSDAEHREIAASLLARDESEAARRLDEHVRRPLKLLTLDD